MKGPFEGNTLSDAAVTSLLTYHWPGNVRELENVMERAVVLAGKGTIRDEHLPAWVRCGCGTEDSPEDPGFSLDAIVDSVERHYIQKTLDACNGVKTAAAKKLGLKRTTLLARMKKLGINGGREGN